MLSSNSKSFLRSWKFRAASFAFLAAALGFLFSLTNHWQKTVSAQELPADTASLRQVQTDARLAAEIRQLTNRSTEGLTVKTNAKGVKSINLERRFQNVVLAQITDGEPAAACVTSVEEANGFFGKDLETGEAVQSTRPQLDKTARAHGMSAEEFEFYQNLIEKAAEQRTDNLVTATIQIVNGDAAGEGFNDPTAAAPEGGNAGTTRGQQRLNLFNEAARIWGEYLDSTVTIKVDAEFNSLTPCTTSGGVLGGAGTTGIFADFENERFPLTWHHAALANKRARVDFDPAESEIFAQFNSDIDNGCLGTGTRFYYGFDNPQNPARINLLVVLLHEIGHGLGFSQFANSSGVQPQNLPDVYNRQMFDRTTGKFWFQMTNAERQTSARNNGNVFFDGSSIKIASGILTGGREASTGRVQMFTPTTFQQGSSVSHWSTTASPNLLMEPFISPDVPLTLDLTRQHMRDVGWYRDSDLNGTPDTITVTAPSGGGRAIGSSVTVTWTNGGGFNKNVSIDLSLDGGTTYPTVLADNIANTGSFTFTVPNTPTGAARIRVREYNFADPAGASFATFAINATGTPARRSFDFDADGRTDVAVVRAAAASNWYISGSQTGFQGVTFGTTGDIIAPADYDGDGRTDVAVFRPGANANWYRINSNTNTFTGVAFGTTGDIPRPGDYDGDGRADISVYRPGASSNFYRLNSNNGAFVGVAFGTTGDIPLVADYDGDGRTDIAVYRPGANSNFYRLNSSNSAFVGIAFGTTGDIPLVGDFEGDGKDDVAVYRAGANSNFYSLNSSNNAFVGAAFGTTGDVPTVGDYDGDGRTDVAVFRAGNWFIQRSTAGFVGIAFGASSDQAVPAAYTGL